MINFPKEMIELKSNMVFSIVKHFTWPNKYAITFKSKGKKLSFDWYKGAVLGEAEHIVSVDDFPRVYEMKAFGLKSEAMNFIEDLLSEVQFSQLSEANFDD